MTAPDTMTGGAGAPLETEHFREYPVFYEADGETVFALHTVPRDERRDVGVVLLGGGWFGTTAGRNRVLVRLARELAASGFDVVRPDWHGMGESSGEIDRYRLHEPFVADLVGAVEVLRAADVPRVVTVGVCFGARTSLSATAHLPELAGLVLASFPVQRKESSGPPRVAHLAQQLTVRESVRRGARLHALRGLTDTRVRRGYRKAWRARWRPPAVADHHQASPTPDPSVVAGLADAARRSLPVLFLYGEEDGDYAVFQRLRDEVVPDASGVGGRVQVRGLPGTLQGFARLEAQVLFTSAVQSWMDTQFPRGGR